jgi:hypothetical protein
VSELVVNLADEASVELAWQILKLVRTDHTVSPADRSKPELPPWEPDDTQAVASAESAAEPSEPDPWAVSAQNHKTPAAATTEPSSATDEDDPWS